MTTDKREKREKIVSDLIAGDCCWDEEDREVLNSFSDEKLAKLAEDQEKQKQREAVANAARKGFEDPGGNTHTFNESTGKWETKEKEPTGNTEEDWLRTAPPEVREDLAFARAKKAEEKHSLIGRIVANRSGKDRERLVELLSQKSLEELRDLALLAPEPKKQPVANYVGAAAPAMVAGVPAGGLTDNEREDFLPVNPEVPGDKS